MTDERLKKPGVQLELPRMGNYLSTDGIGYVTQFENFDKSGEVINYEQAGQLARNRMEEFHKALAMASVILSTAQNKTQAKEQLLECGFYIVTTSAGEFLTIIELYSKALSNHKSLIRLKEPHQKRGLGVYIDSVPEKLTRYYLFPPLDPNLKPPFLTLSFRTL